MSHGSDDFEYDLLEAQRSGNFFERFFHSRRLKEVERIMGTRGRTALDYGCNTGAVLLRLLELGFSAEGFDISGWNAGRARENVRKAGFAAEVYLGELPLKRWDTVLLINVLEYAIDRQKIVDHIRQHLEDHGRLVICVANPAHPFVSFNSVRSFFSGRSKRDVAKEEPASKLRPNEALELLTRSGFRLLKRRKGLGLVNDYFLFEKIPGNPDKSQGS